MNLVGITEIAGLDNERLEIDGQENDRLAFAVRHFPVRQIPVCPVLLFPPVRRCPRHFPVLQISVIRLENNEQHFHVVSHMPVYRSCYNHSLISHHFFTVSFQAEDTSPSHLPEWTISRNLLSLFQTLLAHGFTALVVSVISACHSDVVRKGSARFCQISHAR